MSTEDQAAQKTLRQQIDQLNAQLAKQVPLEVLGRLGQDIESMVRSGMAERSLQAGSEAPDFTLPEARGGTITLSEAVKKGPVVLTFYRGQWCPYCDIALRGYQQALPQLRAHGATLIAVSPQTPDHFLSTAEKKALSFTVLSDVGNRVAQQYKLVFSVDEAVRPIFQSFGSNLPDFNGDPSWQLPMTGTFVIGRDRRIALAYVDADFMKPLEVSAMIAALEKLESRA